MTRLNLQFIYKINLGDFVLNEIRQTKSIYKFYAILLNKESRIIKIIKI